MAWLLPVNQSNGDLITASIWNQNVVANPIDNRTLALGAPATYEGTAEFSNTTSEQTLFTHPLPDMGANDGVEAVFFITQDTAGGGTLTLDIQIGATTALAVDINRNGKRSMQFVAHMANDDSTSAQIVTLTQIFNNATASQTTLGTAIVGAAYNETAVDTSSSVDFKATLEFSTASVSNIAKFNTAIVTDINA